MHFHLCILDYSSLTDPQSKVTQLRHEGLFFPSESLSHRYKLATHQAEDERLATEAQGDRKGPSPHRRDKPLLYSHHTSY